MLQTRVSGQAWLIQGYQILNYTKMWDLLIDCKLNEANKKKPELLQVTKNWFDKNIPELDYSSVFDIEGYHEKGKWTGNIYESGEWINQQGTVAIGDDEFWNEDGTELLEQYSRDYEIAYLKNQIRSIELYIMLSELEEKNELDKIGIIQFNINDGGQFGYRKKTEYAKLDLANCQKELSELQCVVA